MRFTNTIILSSDMMQDIRMGLLRLQIGQWVLIPFAVQACRYMGVINNTVVFLHPPYTIADFKKEAEIKKVRFSNQGKLFAY